MSTTDNPHLEAVSALAEPTRRALYDFVVAQHDWVSRDDAATALGLRRGITAHHLDRLEADGLLTSSRQRRTGRSGPGAGRPAKVYRRSEADHDVSFPPRRYDLAGTLLAQAADRARLDGIPIDAAIDEAARAQGARLAEDVRHRAGAAPTPQRCCEAMLGELSRVGYEPVVTDDGEIVLHNCPFHQLSESHTELICGMNLALLSELSEACGTEGFHARLVPSPDACCVRFDGTAPGDHL